MKRIFALVALIPVIGFGQQIDVRNQSELGNPRNIIEFCARPADAVGEGPGHAFVVFRGHTGEFLAVGYGPEADKKSILPVDGVVLEENFSHKGQRCLSVRVTQAQYATVREKVEAARSFELAGITVPIQSRYYILANDCVTFMSAVARYLGLTVPSRVSGLTPMAMVEALIAANPGR